MLKLDGGTAAGCLAHSRRKFDELIKVNQSPVATQAVQRIAWLYRIEREAQDLAPNDRLATRQARSRPLWDELQEQALSRARTGGVHTLESVAKELNISLGTLREWLKRAGLDAAGLAHAPTLPCDVPAREWTPVRRLLALNESHALSGPALHAWCRERGLPSSTSSERNTLRRGARSSFLTVT